MMDLVDEAVSQWSAGVMRDFIRLFCGELLGNGIGRQVYVLELDPTKVVKVEQVAYSFQNALEWRTWQDLQDTRAARWLAPCHSISPNGTVLIQSRVQPLPRERERERLPEWLSDFKRSNYGLLDGRVVCCDYGTNLLINHGAVLSRKRLRPEWWD